MTTKPDPASEPLAETPPELSRPVQLDKLAGGGVALEINASAAECQALARRFGYLAVESLSARVALDRAPGALIKVEGRLRARIAQACVLTLDPVHQNVDEAFRLSFTRGAEARALADGELLVSASPDAPEPLEGNIIDVGELVAEQLALCADPYPRRPGLSLDDVLKQRKGGVPADRHRPFAGLRKLRDRKP